MRCLRSRMGTRNLRIVVVSICVISVLLLIRGVSIQQNQSLLWWRILVWGIVGILSSFLIPVFTRTTFVGLKKPLGWKQYARVVSIGLLLGVVWGVLVSQEWTVHQRLFWWWVFMLIIWILLFCWWLIRLISSLTTPTVFTKFSQETDFYKKDWRFWSVFSDITHQLVWHTVDESWFVMSSLQDTDISPQPLNENQATDLVVLRNKLWSDSVDDPISDRRKGPVLFGTTQDALKTVVHMTRSKFFKKKRVYRPEAIVVTSQRPSTRRKDQNADLHITPDMREWAKWFWKYLVKRLAVVAVIIWATEWEAIKWIYDVWVRIQASTWITLIVQAVLLIALVVWGIYLWFQRRTQHNAVVLENAEFESLFDVQSTDPVLARSIVTPAFVDTITKRKNDSDLQEITVSMHEWSWITSMFFKPVTEHGTIKGYYEDSVKMIGELRERVLL